MVKHYIIMSSSYSDGQRIALDIVQKHTLDMEKITQTIKEIKLICGKNVPLSTHLIETNSLEWDSVAAYDPFFKDVMKVISVTQFAEKIKKDRKLTGLDVANYILSKKKVTHLALQKLVYFAYAEYLCKTNDKLFDDKIYAFSYGPVIDSVYEMFKRSGYDPLSTKEDKDCTIDVKEMPIRSRILFAEDGANKVETIDEVIRKYGRLSASTLVDLTHRAGSPWQRTNSRDHYVEIPDERIKKYHYVETM